MPSAAWQDNNHESVDSPEPPLVELLEHRLKACVNATLQHHQEILEIAAKFTFAAAGQARTHGLDIAAVDEGMHTQAKCAEKQLCDVRSPPGLDENESSAKVAEIQPSPRPTTELKSRGTTFFAKRGAVFADPDRMKDMLRANLFKPEYDVTQFYHESGCCQAIAKSVILDQLTLVVIVINAVWLSIDLDYNDSDSMLGADMLFQVAENAFCIYFSLEVFARFGAFKEKRSGLRDRWFVFDSILVVLMIFETWVVSLFLIIAAEAEGTNLDLTNMSVLRVMRLLRLTRMARLVKVLRAVPEVTVFFKGLAAASRAVAVTMAILMCIMYIFAILLRTLLEGTDAGSRFFRDVPASMYTLLVYGIFLDGLAKVLEDVNRDSAVAGTILVAYVFTASLTILNMLVGVLCNMVATVATIEKENLDLVYIRGQLEKAIRKTLHRRSQAQSKASIDNFTDQESYNSNLDNDEQGIDLSQVEICEDEYTKILYDKGLTQALHEVGIELEALVDFADVIFGTTKSKKIPFDQFIKLIMQFRGQNTATVKDIVGMRKFFELELQDVLKKISLFERNHVRQIQKLELRILASDRSVGSVSQVRALDGQVKSCLGNGDVWSV